MPRIRTSVVAGVVLLAACHNMGGVRPNIPPMNTAEITTIHATPDYVTQVIAAMLDTARLPVGHVAPLEGYVETRWMDAVSHAPSSPGPGNLRNVIKLRFFADPVAGATQLVAECVRRYRTDPSLPSRELEEEVPDDHPGKALMDSVLARLARQEHHVAR